MISRCSISRALRLQFSNQSLLKAQRPGTSRIVTRQFGSTSSAASGGALQAPTSVSPAPLSSLKSELDKIAPCFSINANQIEIIKEPKEFYETLKVRNPRVDGRRPTAFIDHEGESHLADDASGDSLRSSTRKGEYSSRLSTLARPKMTWYDLDSAMTPNSLLERYIDCCASRKSSVAPSTHSFNTCRLFTRDTRVARSIMCLIAFFSGGGVWRPRRDKDVPYT